MARNETNVYSIDFPPGSNGFSVGKPSGRCQFVYLYLNPILQEQTGRHYHYYSKNKGSKDINGFEELVDCASGVLLAAGAGGWSTLLPVARYSCPRLFLLVYPAVIQWKSQQFVKLTPNLAASSCSALIFLTCGGHVELSCLLPRTDRTSRLAVLPRRS